MTWTVVVLIAIAYVLIGAFVGYFMFCEDEMGMLLGVVAWPLFLTSLIFFLAVHGLYKFVDFVVKSIKRVWHGMRRKSKGSVKESLGLGTDEKEHFTKCDRCPWLKDCRDLGRVIDVTGKSDSRLHYILQLGETCDRGLFHWDYDEEEEE